MEFQNPASVRYEEKQRGRGQGVESTQVSKLASMLCSWASMPVKVFRAVSRSSLAHSRGRQIESIM